ncbi:MAG: hypothetical protein K6F99_03720 [Lachnospiraceae bacterium]|nr:hypothetical protein [Lachnospiraceae bacterium]
MEHGNLFDKIEKNMADPFAEAIKRKEATLPPVMPPNPIEAHNQKIGKPQMGNNPPLANAQKKKTEKPQMGDNNNPPLANAQKEKNEKPEIGNNNNPPLANAQKKKTEKKVKEPVKEPVQKQKGEDENAPIFEKEKDVDKKTSFKRVSYDYTKKVLKRENVDKAELTDRIMEAYAYAQDKDKKSATVKGKTKNKRLAEYSSKTSKIAMIKREESAEGEKLAKLKSDAGKNAEGLDDSTFRLIGVLRDQDKKKGLKADPEEFSLMKSLLANETKDEAYDGFHEKVTYMEKVFGLVMSTNIRDFAFDSNLNLVQKGDMVKKLSMLQGFDNVKQLVAKYRDYSYLGGDSGVKLAYDEEQLTEIMARLSAFDEIKQTYEARMMLFKNPMFALIGKTQMEALSLEELMSRRSLANRRIRQKRGDKEKYQTLYSYYDAQVRLRIIKEKGHFTRGSNPEKLLTKYRKEYKTFDMSALNHTIVDVKLEKKQSAVNTQKAKKVFNTGNVNTDGDLELARRLQEEENRNYNNYYDEDEALAYQLQYGYAKQPMFAKKKNYLPKDDPDLKGDETRDWKAYCAKFDEKVYAGFKKNITFKDNLAPIDDEAFKRILYMGMSQLKTLQDITDSYTLTDKQKQILYEGYKMLTDIRYSGTLKSHFSDLFYDREDAVKAYDNFILGHEKSDDMNKHDAHGRNPDEAGIALNQREILTMFKRIIYMQEQREEGMKLLREAREERPTLNYQVGIKDPGKLHYEAQRYSLSCWSCATASIINYKRIQHGLPGTIKQKDVLKYKLKFKDNSADTADVRDNIKSFMKKDGNMGNAFAVGDMFFDRKILPFPVSVHNFTIPSSSNESIEAGLVEKRKVEFIKAVAEGLKHGPIATLKAHHYVSIVRIDGEMLYVRNSQPGTDSDVPEYNDAEQPISVDDFFREAGGREIELTWLEDMDDAEALKLQEQSGNKVVYDQNKKTFTKAVKGVDEYRGDRIAHTKGVHIATEFKSGGATIAENYVYVKGT